MENENNEQKQTPQYSDRFSRLMFGPFPPRQAVTEHSKDRSDTSEPAQEIDFVKLMEDINTLVSSFEKFKPIINKITPLFDLFKK
jgi:hypothetical protein